MVANTPQRDKRESEKKKIVFFEIKIVF